jgi:uncharacterized membrane protein YfcA
MTPMLIALVTLTAVGTSFLSGIFGMAGGLILVGVLLAIMPLPAAMMLHAITQMGSNGWRALLWRKHIRWRAVGAYMFGCMVALGVWSLWRYVPPTPFAMLMLGVTPFIPKLVPKSIQPDAESRVQGGIYGAVCMSLLLLTGVAGPLLDMFFLGGKLDRREIISTKAICQVFGHCVKLVYFGTIIDQAAGVEPTVAVLAILASMLGTTLSKRVLDMMTDVQYRLWAKRIVTTIAAYYIAYGSWLMVTA